MGRRKSKTRTQEILRDGVCKVNQKHDLHEDKEKGTGHVDKGAPPDEELIRNEEGDGSNRDPAKELWDPKAIL
jgi:hypothetical protein